MTRDGDAVTAAGRPNLQQLLRRSALTHFIGVHDALSAIIAEKAGAMALWVSGFGLSTTLGYRDASEMAWTTLADFVERVGSLVDLPLLVDIDTGFGDANNARLVTETLRRRGAGGVCIEDKSFPKINSFVDAPQQLISVSQFQAKIEACKRAGGGQDFVVVARTEALVSGAGLGEALLRAAASAEAGADAVLVHSRHSTAAEVVEFSSKWNGRLPLLVVPTTYAASPSIAFSEAGIKGVIWANQPLRAGAAAISSMCRYLLEHEGPARAPIEMVPVTEIFELYRYDNLTS